MLSAFGIDHGISKAFKPKAMRLEGMMRKTHPQESMRQRAETNYIQNRLMSGRVGPQYHQAAKAGNPIAQAQTQLARRGRQETKSWETAANNMNRRKPGTGIGRMEAQAESRLAVKPKPKKRFWQR